VLNGRALLVGMALLLAFSPERVVGATPGDAPVIDPDVRAAVTRGPARVLVDLRLPAPSASDTDPRPPREPAIAATRQIVLARLTGTAYRLVRQYRTVPLLALEIGADALAALERMGDVVVRVRVDKVLPPATPR